MRLWEPLETRQLRNRLNSNTHRFSRRNRPSAVARQLRDGVARIGA